MSAKTDYRHQALIAAVLAGTHDAEALSRHLGVSLVTIRRDLAQLSAQGRLVRTFGGAVSAAGHEPESTLAQRRNKNKKQKEAIARLAAGEIHSGETIILDGGTTTGALASQLRGRRNLRIITNSLQVMAILAGDEGVELIMLGGTMRPKSLSTVGPLAEMTLRRLTADRVFLGADGVVAGRGLCEASFDQIQLKELMMAQATTTYVLADSSKLGRAAQQAWAPLDQPWTLITDGEADTQQVERFRSLSGVTVNVATK
ncbi:MAG: DeoR/GlpR family DNA-binding transcription regulator [Betaproteobacteria bacterium]